MLSKLSWLRICMLLLQLGLARTAFEDEDGSFADKQHLGIFLNQHVDRIMDEIEQSD